MVAKLLRGTERGGLTRWFQHSVLARFATRTAAAQAPIDQCLPSAAHPVLSLAGHDEQALLVQRFLDLGRAALLLRPAIAQTIAAPYLEVAREALRKEMAWTSGGDVLLTDWSCPVDETSEAPPHVESVSAYFLDRHPTTNRQYQAFVSQGGYSQESIWDPSIWPRVSEFHDTTGAPGPRGWIHGEHASDAADCPVVGVCWFEACAYARWAGKRLPTDAEWVKVAASPAGSGTELIQRRFPWGDVWDPARCNLWISGQLKPCSVDQYPQGNSASSVGQLIGNVWEWTASDLNAIVYGNGVHFETPLKSIRGGAFDTYFDNQANCQLNSGETALARRRNIGFRCALSSVDIISLEAPG